MSPYPFPKLDLIGLPLMKGGMENAGAPIFGDDILTPGDHASPAQYHFFGSIVAHELSHQWFGDMVTPTWWNDIWIKESFAQETGSIIASEWRTGPRLYDQPEKERVLRNGSGCAPRPTGIAQRPQ